MIAQLHDFLAEIKLPGALVLIFAMLFATIIIDLIVTH